MKKRYTEEQIIGFLRAADASIPVKDTVPDARVFRRALLPLVRQIRRHAGA
jgi:hypothetical protein